MIDCLQNVSVPLQRIHGIHTSALVVVASNSHALWLRGVLNSYTMWNNLTKADAYVLLLDESEACRALAAEFGAYVIQAECLSPMGSWSKSVVYNIADILPHEHFICIDVDTLVLGSLQSKFDELKKPHIVLQMARDAQFLNTATKSAAGSRPFIDQWHGYYQGKDDKVLGVDTWIGQYPIIISDGVICANRLGMRLLVSRCKTLYVFWREEINALRRRNQAVANVAFIEMFSLPENKGVDLLDEKYNLQVGASRLNLVEHESSLHFHNGKRPYIAHFPGKKGKALCHTIRDWYQK